MPVEVEIEVGNALDKRVGASEVHCGGFPATGIIVGSEVSEGIRLGMAVVSSEGIPKYEYVTLPSV
jgi:hypothetical protein